MVAIKFLSIALLALLAPNLHCSAAKGSASKGSGGILDQSRFPDLVSSFAVTPPEARPMIQQQPKLQPTAAQTFAPEAAPKRPSSEVPSCNASDESGDEKATPPRAATTKAIACEEMLGKPFSPADLGAQDKPQVSGIMGRYDMPAIGWTVSQYLDDILTTGTAIDAFTKNGPTGGFKNPKMRERATEALAADMRTLEEDISQILATTDTFAKTEQAALTAFLAARTQRYDTFIRNQRSKFFKAMNRVDRLIAMITTIEGAKGSVGESLIKDECAALSTIKTSLAEGLAKHQKGSLALLEEQERTTITHQQLQADELHAELFKIDRMLNNLHALHPQRSTLPQPTELPPYQTITQLKQLRR